jgi:hypothetical protein
MHVWTSYASITAATSIGAVDVPAPDQRFRLSAQRSEARPLMTGRSLVRRWRAMARLWHVVSHARPEWGSDLGKPWSG